VVDKLKNLNNRVGVLEGNSLSCTVVKSGDHGGITDSPSCPGGYVRTGCGHDGSTGSQAWPNGDKCRCDFPGDGHCYAICCKIN